MHSLAAYKAAGSHRFHSLLFPVPCSLFPIQVALYNKKFDRLISKAINTMKPQDWRALLTQYRAIAVIRSPNLQQGTQMATAIAEGWNSPHRNYLE